MNRIIYLILFFSLSVPAYSAIVQTYEFQPMLNSSVHISPGGAATGGGSYFEFGNVLSLSKPLPLCSVGGTAIDDNVPLTSLWCRAVGWAYTAGAGIAADEIVIDGLAMSLGVTYAAVVEADITINCPRDANDNTTGGYIHSQFRASDMKGFDGTYWVNPNPPVSCAEQAKAAGATPALTSSQLAQKYPPVSPTKSYQDTGVPSPADTASDNAAIAKIDAGGITTAEGQYLATNTSPSCSMSATCQSCVAAAASLVGISTCLKAAAGKGTGTGTAGTGTGASGTTPNTGGTGASGTGTSSTGGTGASGTSAGTGPDSQACKDSKSGAGAGAIGEGQCSSYELAVNACYHLDDPSGDWFSRTMTTYSDYRCDDMPNAPSADGSTSGAIAAYWNGVYAYQTGAGGSYYPYKCPAKPKPAPRDPKTGKPVDPCVAPSGTGTGGTGGTGTGTGGTGATSGDIKGLQDSVDSNGKATTDGINKSNEYLKNIDGLLNRSGVAPDGIPAYVPQSGGNGTLAGNGTIGGVWDSKKGSLSQSTDKITDKIKELMPQPSGGGTCPLSDMSLQFEMFDTAIASPATLNLTCEFIGVLRAFILIMAAASARSILFGR